MNIYIILLTWNDPFSSIRCLQSIQATNHPNLTVIVVDNNSQDETVATIKDMFPHYRIIVNEKNLGFGAGCNVGLKVALAEEADFVMLINQDTVVDTEIFTHLIKATQTYPKAGIFAPKTYFLAKTDNGHERLLYTGSWRGRLPLQQHIPDIEAPDNGLHNTPRQVDFAWGHGLFMDSQMLQKIGLFDEAYFMYFEDLDLCRRATTVGYEIWYTPTALIWHDISDGARTSNPDPTRFQYKADSLLNFYHKYYGRFSGHLLAALHTFDEARQMWGRNHKAAAKLTLKTWLKSLIRNTPTPPHNLA